MTEEKKSLMKTLKDENLRSETRRYTANLMNKTNNSISNTSRSFLSSNNNMLNNMYDNNNPNNDILTNNIEKRSVKKKKKIKKKKDGKNPEKIVKSGEIIKKEKGQKIKLLKYEKLNDNPNEENKEDKNDSKIENKEEKNKKENEVKPIIKDKEKKTNRTRQDLLNSLYNLQYNYDNLMALGIHGTKILNNNKK